ncbi:hypothetical protein JKF63_03048 [Porcisia hertigi]|uniref:Uncharacterized protein n=1 Tax=Porcisia hertigi TaxID=2761500 RepID=A0A836IMN8_9TRYP|nr:hypothetical protein JKF63_03048 [Porcisia hertigi]
MSANAAVEDPVGDRSGDSQEEPEPTSTITGKVPMSLLNQPSSAQEQAHEDYAEPEGDASGAEERDNRLVPPSTGTSSSARRSNPGTTEAHRHTRDSSVGRSRGAAPARGKKKVMCEKLLPAARGSLPKHALPRGGTRTTSQTMPTAPSVSAASNAGGFATAAAVPPQAAQVSPYPHDCPLKELDKHGDKNAFGLDLRAVFQKTKFSQVHREYQRISEESIAVQECERLFRVISKNKSTVDALDIQELLIIFTPCGVLLREGADFLREECGGKSSLTFVDFLRYGPALRARIRAFEIFERLSDRQKLISIHARVLRSDPPVGVNTARLQLLRVADQQVRGMLPRHVRPLRLYETNFIVDYQERLHDAALIPGSETLPPGLRGDYADELGRAHHVRHLPPLPQLSASALQKEDVAWREENVVDYTDSEESSASANAADAEKSAAVRCGESAHPVVSKRGCRVAAPKGSRKVGNRQRYTRKRSPYVRRADTAPATGLAATYGTSSGWTAVGSGRTQGKAQQKPMGRFVEDEYRERRTMDDHLITQLEFMYSMP